MCTSAGNYVVNLQQEAPKARAWDERCIKHQSFSCNIIIDLHGLVLHQALASAYKTVFQVFVVIADYIQRFLLFYFFAVFWPRLMPSFLTLDEPRQQPITVNSVLINLVRSVPCVPSLSKCVGRQMFGG